MDILKSMELEGIEGFTTVPTFGISRPQIVSVHRQGIQYDYVSALFLGTSNRSWSMFGSIKKIQFRSDTPFAAGGETIFIIYKVTT